VLKVNLSSLTSLSNMPRRKKKSHLTRKKVTKAKHTIGIPTDSEWRTMPDFASFVGTRPSPFLITRDDCLYFSR
jgi:hypothetical protein